MFVFLVWKSFCERTESYLSIQLRRFGFWCVLMGMEASLVDPGRDRVGHVNKVGYVRRIIAKRRKPCRSRVKRQVLTVPKALKDLFDSCRETFKGPDTVPSPQDVQKMCHILGMISLHSLDEFG